MHKEGFAGVQSSLWLCPATYLMYSISKVLQAMTSEVISEDSDFHICLEGMRASAAHHP